MNATLAQPFIQPVDVMLATTRREDPTTEAATGPAGVRSALLETWSDYWLQLALPAIDVKHLNIQVVGRQVVIRAGHTLPLIENAVPVWDNLDDGYFEKSFWLPAEVEGRGAEAEYQRGILSLRLPKLAYVRPIPIHIVETDA